MTPATTPTSTTPRPRSPDEGTSQPLDTDAPSFAAYLSGLGRALSLGTTALAAIATAPPMVQGASLTDPQGAESNTPSPTDAAETAEDSVDSAESAPQKVRAEQNKPGVRRPEDPIAPPDITQLSANELKTAPSLDPTTNQPNTLTKPLASDSHGERTDSDGSLSHAADSRQDVQAKPEGTTQVQQAQPSYSAAPAALASGIQPAPASQSKASGTARPQESAPITGPAPIDAPPQPGPSPHAAPSRRVAPAAGQATAAGKVSRPVTGLPGSPQPLSSKDAINRLTAQAPVLRRAVEQQSLVLQTARGLSSALKQGDGTVTLSLQPPRLGQLKVHITLQDSMVSARIEPTTVAARQLLVESEPSLRAALEARGLSVERIDVDAVKPPAHAIDPVPAPEASQARQEGMQTDHPGGELAGSGDQTGSGAEAHAGGAGMNGRTDVSSQDLGGAAHASMGGSGSAALTYALDDGGTYRLSLDAMA